MGDVPNPIADELSALGSELSNRLLEFQRRFAVERLKCDHYVVDSFSGRATHGELGARRRGVGFKKEGNQWKLHFVEEGEREREPNQLEVLSRKTRGLPVETTVREEYRDWIELSRCSLTTKAMAAKLLPKLLDEMRKEHQRRRDAVCEALKVLGELDSQLPPVEKEGA